MSAQPPEYQPQLSLWVRQLLTIILLVGCIYLLTLIAPVLPMLTIAFLIAFVMFIPSRSLARRTPVPYAIAVILLYACLIVVFVLGMLILTPSLVSGVNNLINSFQQGYNELILTLQTLRPQDAVLDVLGVQINMSDLVRTAKSFLLNGSVSQTTGFLMPSQLQATVQPQPIAWGDLFNQILPLFGPVSQTVTSAIGTVTGFVGSFLLALFVSFLVLLDVPHTQNMFAQQVPSPYQREFALIVRKIVHVWNAFFRGQVLIGFAIGVLTFIQLSWMGISNAFILAVITGTISLIPTIGGIIALIPLGLIPLIQGSQAFPQVPHPVMALLVVGINLLITQIIWNVLAPKVLGDALNLPLAVIIVGVFVGAAAGGVLGAFLVAPVIASLRVFLAYLWHKINLEDPFPNEPAPFEWGNDPFLYQGQSVRVSALAPMATKTWGKVRSSLRQPGAATQRHSEKE